MNSVSTASLSIEPVVGTVRIADGRRLEATHCAAVLDAPSRAARGREGEYLFILLNLSGPASPHLYRELREVVAQTYWSATGSITAALRRAATAANRHLFHYNLRAVPADRCEGGLVCAVSRDDDLFILQSGSIRACFLHGGQTTCFSRGEDPRPLGTAQVVDAHLHHTFLASEDTLLLTTPDLIRVIGQAGLARVLPRPEMAEVLDGLEQIGGGTNFVALVVRWVPPSAASLASAPADREAPRLLDRFASGLRRPKPRETLTVSQVETPDIREVSQYIPSPSPEPPEPEPQEALVVPQIEIEEEPADLETPPDYLDPEASALSDFDGASRPVEPYQLLPSPLPSPSDTAPEPDDEPGPSLEERLDGLKKGARAVGHGFAAASVWLAGGAGTLFRRMLPGSERAARPRTRPPRPVPPENRALMMATAIIIPLVLAIAVVTTYLSFGAQSRFEGLIDQAEQAVALAQTSGGFTAEARPHWEIAKERAGDATELRPDDQVAAALQAQAQTALDLIDGIGRLQLVQLWDFGPSTAPRRLTVHGQIVFVLDPAGGWVIRLTLDPLGSGTIEQGDVSPLIQAEQQIGGGTIGDLVDLVWVDPGGERLTSGLLVLEKNGTLVSYDPAWENTGGTPQLKRSFLGTPPNAPSIVGTYEGRFYVLDTDINQIRRYEPRGDIYPDTPDYYFVDPDALPRRPADAQDMAIDGYIYILYRDGMLLKFLRGELQPFEVHGVPGGITQAVALAVDPDGSSGAIYVADKGVGRVIVLESDGAFRAQLRADVAFDALEALAVDEASGRLYVMNGGQLYVASLP